MSMAIRQRTLSTAAMNRLDFLKKWVQFEYQVKREFGADVMANGISGAQMEKVMLTFAIWEDSDIAMAELMDCVEQFKKQKGE